ncbi:tail assembly protein [Sinorhizobium fredii]|uniref:tail assembly protein n=1 Tax=Rhizobium fredii TaxID=380 RepID=UPI0004BC3781|nr:tail assembly protein [Sinorhizobium fredii]
MRSDLVTVRLHGPLKEKYGDEYRLAIHSAREAVEALEANFPGFRRDFLKAEHYALLVDGDWRDETNCPEVADAPIGREVDICPVIEGRIFGPIVAALGWVGITGTAATIIGGAISVGLLLGVSMLLSPKPKRPTGRDSARGENYIFTGPENVTEQGVPVPLVYGRCFVGSVTVSEGLETAEGVGTTSDNSWVWNRLALPASLHDMALDDPAVVREALRQTPPAPPEEKHPAGRTWPRWVGENS